MNRIASGVLALGVTAGAAFALRVSDPLQAPSALAFVALSNNPSDVPKAVALYREAVRQDSANPYRWTDLGAALQTAGDVPNARYCFQRALQLSGDVPQIWLRDANFHFELDEPEAGLHSAARVLKVVPDYDPVLFGYFDRFGLSTADVLTQIGDDRRATRSFTTYLIQTKNMNATAEAWAHAFTKGFADDQLTASYIDALLAAHRYSEARRDWVRYLGDARGDFPDRNLLFNAGFEKEPSGVALDWRIQPSADFDTSRESSEVHDGKWALKIRFHGTGNVSYRNVVQKAYLPPGTYSLKAWVRSDSITTNECPQLEVWDADSPTRVYAASHPFCGTTGWTLITLSFTVASQENLVSVGIVRDPSQKFDNKIDGSFWSDSLQLLRE